MLNKAERTELERYFAAQARALKLSPTSLETADPATLRAYCALVQYSELRHGENSLPAPPFCVLLSQNYSLRSVIKRVFL
ncbi:hypothetical protein [Deinococcus sp.]|uniref:hypothetical protein n=1 Tax=Deinococcus sp. TaxID=47478 RepID=UPI0025D72244|nr:hypothetical protein [Deinococcus sp.]